MGSQNSELSVQTPHGKIPSKWEEKFLIKRIGEKDIEITLDERNGILKALNNGDRFVQIGKYTLMLNGIKSIDPKYGAQNIPPRPKWEYEGMVSDQPLFDRPLSNQKEHDEWNKLFGKSVYNEKQKQLGG